MAVRDRDAGGQDLDAQVARKPLATFDFVASDSPPAWSGMPEGRSVPGPSPVDRGRDLHRGHWTVARVRLARTSSRVESAW